MAYTEITVLVLDEQKDIVLAELHELGFEGTWDKGNELVAYIPSNLFQHKEVYDTLAKYGMENNFSHQLLEDKNWNEEWEKNYDPVFIDERVYVRSPFHPSVSTYQHEIIIQPQMSFGTGHHQTTRLMIEMMLTMDFSHRLVLDMGTGTGVLVILASMLGASEVCGIDNDLNSVENAIENLKYNKVKKVNYVHGSHDAIPDRDFDIVLSNITKNINVSLLPHLVESVSPDGYIVLSGFLGFDLLEMDKLARKLSLKIVRNMNLGDWECLLYQKSK